jgi:hypothetical protein
MRWITISAAAAVAVMALLGAESALAGTKLDVTANGVPLPAGAEVQQQLEVFPESTESLGSCTRLERGTIETNGKSGDRFSFGEVVQLSCSEGASLSNVNREVKLNSIGDWGEKFVGKLVFRGPGPCIYGIGFLNSPSWIPGGPASFGRLHGIGRLNRKASSPSCKHTEYFVGNVELRDMTETELFTELRG